MEKWGVRKRREEGGRGSGTEGNEGRRRDGGSRKRKQGSEEERRTGREDRAASEAARTAFSFPTFLPYYLHQKQMD